MARSGVNWPEEKKTPREKRHEDLFLLVLIGPSHPVFLRGVFCAEAALHRRMRSFRLHMNWNKTRCGRTRDKRRRRRRKRALMSVTRNNRGSNVIYDNDPLAYTRFTMIKCVRARVLHNERKEVCVKQFEVTDFLNLPHGRTGIAFFNQSP